MNNNYKVCMISLGCPKNQVDAEIMLTKLVESGFEAVANIEDADLVIVNTCGFIDDAKTEAIDTILEVAQYKEAGIISAIVVTGCLAERYHEEVMQELHEVDAVIGIGANADIVKVCQKALCGIKSSMFPNKLYLPIDDMRIPATPPHWAYVKIAEGCDNRCSYCAIPGIRGRFRSRTMESIFDEVTTLAAKGVKEIILVAQDTTKYGQDIYGDYSLDKLLRRLVTIDGIEWIRLFYCYPQRITDSLIKTIKEENKVCNYLDIPLQHSHPFILKAMNRIGSGKDYKVLIEKLRKEIPDLILRTTFMVGFPGESEEHFDNLCRFIKDVRFDRMGCFAFSPEEGTPACEMHAQIDDNMKDHRRDLIMDIQYGITTDFNKSRVGNVYRAIVDSYDDGVYTGRSYMDSPEIDTGINFTSDTELEIGSFVDVKITDFDGYDLIGEKI